MVVTEKKRPPIPNRWYRDEVRHSRVVLKCPMYTVLITRTHELSRSGLISHMKKVESGGIEDFYAKETGSSQVPGDMPNSP